MHGNVYVLLFTFLCMHSPFHIFGSHSSHDYDIVLFVNQLETTQQNHAFCDAQALTFNAFFAQKGLPQKKINLNLAILVDGIIDKVYKGTPDELNNAVLRTYALHAQYHPLLVRRAVERNWQLKMIRVCRTVLSFYTRTYLRADVKRALQGNLDLKLEVLENLSLAAFATFEKNEPQDCWKTIAFQLGQGMGLLQEQELYTKEEIASAFPQLEIFLQRKTAHADLETLETQKRKFLAMLIQVRPQFCKLTEQEWG